MCLDRITRRIKRPTSRVRKVYKVFLRHPDCKLSHVVYPFNRAKLIEGLWLRAEGDKITTFTSVFAVSAVYPAGFHAFIKKRDAKFYASVIAPPCFAKSSRVVVLPVEIRRVETIGTQYFTDGPPYATRRVTVLVARELRVPLLPVISLSRSEARRALREVLGEEDSYPCA